MSIIVKGMSCPSLQWHRTGSSWSPVRTLRVAPLWCDLGFVQNSRGNKAAANLRPVSRHGPKVCEISQKNEVKSQADSELHASKIASPHILIASPAPSAALLLHSRDFKIV